MASLLLRLFNSDYFSPHLALSYLRTYSDHVGITYFLIAKLCTDFAPEDVEFYWPQYWYVAPLTLSHLLVTKPSESRALESFILRRCEEDVHIAFVTLWYIQAQLADLAGNPSAPAFRTCQRVYNRCQRILFEDPDANPSPSRSALQRFLPFFDARRKVLPSNPHSCLVGMGASLVGIGCPHMANYAGTMALQQGRRPDGTLHTTPAEHNAPSAPPSNLTSSGPPEARLSEAPVPKTDQEPRTTPSHDPVQDAFGQTEEAQLAMRSRACSASLPGLPAHPAPHARAAASVSDLAPAPAQAPDASAYSLAAQQQYLRTHFGRTETQFLQALQDIATRLQPLPKLARLSALRAELTALNHTLPTEVCFPTWCRGTPEDHTTKPERHHRVVRISASEAVVLNSADRVPYLLHVEVLCNDLDFDPTRRYNRELLQRILGLKNNGTPLAPFLLVHRDEAHAAPTDAPATPAQASAAAPQHASAHAEEMDLTEQMYGADLAAFGIERDLDKGLGEKNHTLDSAAWAHAAQASRADFTLEEYAQRMRTAAVMLAQLNSGVSRQEVMTHTPATPAPQSWSSWIVGTPAPEPSAQTPTPSATNLLATDTEKIRQRIMDEMAALEEQRMERMKKGGKFFGRHKPNMLAAEDETAVLRAVNKDDPSAAYFRESWTAKRERIRTSSPYGHLPNWDLFSVIVKTGADLRQEQFAVQLINEFRRVWQDCGSRCWVRYFRIVVLNEQAGLIETITDALSVHSIKKDAYARQLDGSAMATYSLYDHFVQTYGEPHTPRFRRARRHFSESLAGYAIVSYLLQIKDRHNGNILVDTEGHLIHIDFGFMLGISPGGVGFEAAPFKLPKDYIEILGGMDSDGFHEFKQLMRQGFRDVRKHAERFIMLVELMQKDSNLPCFALGDLATAHLRDRFQLTLTASQCDEYVDRLILSSAGSAFTRLYDQYQNFTQNIL